tara:strand:+ start:222 stop:629 length:408 start_codon:yes stop_codon:yes gene_type:complete
MFTVNNLVTLTSIIVLLMILTCKNEFKSEEFFYLVLIVDLLILMASLKEKFDEKFYPNYYEIIPNRHPEKFVRRKKCFLRSKEHNDYKESINNRLDKEREMEEQDRKGMIFKHEMDKLVEMGDENLEYIVNGENF